LALNKGRALRKKMTEHDELQAADFQSPDCSEPMSATDADIQRVNVLGIGLSVLNLDLALAAVKRGFLASMRSA
jgi:hypothetical protein